MKLLAIDPGMDDTGYAVFLPCCRPRTVNDALRALLESGTISTDTRDTDPERLASLGLQIRHLVEAHGPSLAAVEVPAYAGNYGGRQARRAGVNKLFQAIGAIFSRLAGVEVLTVPALNTKKETRHQLLDHAAQVIGVELPQGPRGGSREDEWDAIWIGVQTLLEHHY